MRLVAHPSFVRRKALRYGTLTASALLGLLAASIGAYFRPSLLWVGGMFACLALLKEFLSPTLSAVQGYAGEQTVLKQLQTLPDDYVAIANLVLPGSKRGDIDIVLLGQMGVLVVEVKAYSGHIRYEGGRWWRVQNNGWKTRLKSVSAQAKGNGRDLEAFLHSKGYSCRVQSILVFVGTEQLETTELKMPVVKVQEIAAYAAGVPKRVSAEQVEQMAALLSPQTLGG